MTLRTNFVDTSQEHAELQEALGLANKNMRALPALDGDAPQRSKNATQIAGGKVQSSVIGRLREFTL